MAKIIIPTPLRKFTDNQSSFQTNGDTVKEAIAQLIETYNGLTKHLLDDNQNIRSFIRIYVEDTKVAADTVISIVPAIAGGSK